MAEDQLAQGTEFIKGFVPKIGNFGSNAASFGAWIIIALLFLSLAAFGAWWYTRNKKFNKTIYIYEKIANKWEHTRTDKAMEVSFSTSGDTIFYLRKHKKYLPNPTLQSGRRVYYFYIRKDDEWINFELADLDEQAALMGAKFLDKEMRFARTQIQKGLKERYDKPGFWATYGQTVMNIVYYVLMGMMVWLAIGKFIDLVGSLDGVVQKIDLLMERSNSIIESLGNACSSTKGYVPIG